VAGPLEGGCFFVGGQLPAKTTAAPSATPQGEHDPWGRPLDDAVVLVLHTWTYAGTGYSITPGAQLALASADRARAHDQAVPVI